MYTVIEKYRAVKYAIKVIPKAVWEEQTLLAFSSNGSSSKIENAGAENVEAIAVDEVFSDKNCTVFIKLDIEGSELQALKGARKTIQNDRTFIGVCVYHRRQDLFAIREYLDEVSGNGYHYFLRYYGDNFRELVMYCVP